MAIVGDIGHYRVLVLTGMYPDDETPGNGLAVKLQCESLLELGMDVDVLFFKVWNFPSILGAIGRLRRMERSKRYDIIHVHHGFKASMISMFSSLPRVFTFHGTDILGYTRMKGLNLVASTVYHVAAYGTRFLSRFARAVIVMSDEMKRCLPAAVQQRVSVIPMGINVEQFNYLGRAEARNVLGWGDEPVIAFVDNHNNHVKRLDLATAAAEKVREQLPETRLVLIQGFKHEQMPHILSASDCLLVTSDMEGSPNTVRESIACRLPVVSVDAGDIRHLLDLHHGMGHIVERDPQSIADAVLTVLQSNQTRPSPASIHALSLQSVARQVADVYTRVLTR